jgi:hypothetical protein
MMANNAQFEISQNWYAVMSTKENLVVDSVASGDISSFNLARRHNRIISVNVSNKTTISIGRQTI